MPTQDGRNTFGFLWNGQAWTPKGFDGNANLRMWFDPTSAGGQFNIGAYRYIDSATLQTINIFGDSIQGPEKIVLPNAKRIGATIHDDVGICDYNTNDTLTRITGGYFEFTKVDKANGIFSGRFEIKITKPGCQDLEITLGRFDMKL